MPKFLPPVISSKVLPAEVFRRNLEDVKNALDRELKCYGIQALLLWTAQNMARLAGDESIGDMLKRNCQLYAIPSGDRPLTELEEKEFAWRVEVLFDKFARWFFNSRTVIEFYPRRDEHGTLLCFLAVL